MNFISLTIGKDLSHTHWRGPWTAAGKHWRVKTSGSLLSSTLILIRTNGTLPTSSRVNKGRHQTPLFSMAHCSQNIFSPVGDLFIYPVCLIKHIHQSEDPKEIFVGYVKFMYHSGNLGIILLPYFIIRVH